MHPVAVDREEHLPPGGPVQLDAARGQQAELSDRQGHRRRDARESRAGSHYDLGQDRPHRQPEQRGREAVQPVPGPDATGTRG